MSLRAGFLGACPYPLAQGSQVFMRDHALAFCEAGHNAHLITYGHGVGEDTSGLPLHRGGVLPGRRATRSGPSFAKPLLDLSLVFTVRRVARRERLNVIFAHNYEALLVALAARACPVIYHAHNTMEDELPHYFRDAAWAARFGRWLDRAFPRRAAAVIAPHARLAAHLRDCGCVRVDIVPPPVWLEQFEAAPVSDGLPPVLYTGNLDPYQNLSLLHQAMLVLRERLPAARLRIATAAKGAAYDAEVVPVTELVGLRAVLAEDSVLASPRTSWSGYPVKILNAMAAGKAIVACAGAAHALTHGENALVVEDDNAKAFADALHAFLTQPELRARLGAAARETAAREHGPAETGARLAEIARRVLATR